MFLFDKVASINNPDLNLSYCNTKKHSLIKRVWAHSNKSNDTLFSFNMLFNLKLLKNILKILLSDAFWLVLQYGYGITSATCIFVTTRWLLYL